VRYFLWWAASALFRAMPLRAAYGLADISGFATFWLWPRGRRNTVRNFARVLPRATPGERRRIARRSLQNYCRYLVDFLRLPQVTRGQALARTSGDDAFAALDRALRYGRGAVIACMHFGNWDLGAAGTAARDYRGGAIGERFGDARLDAAVFEARRALGIAVFPMDGPLLGAVRHLRGNGVLALLLDRPGNDAGVEVTFFGAPTTLPQGPARLALRTGAALGVAAFPRVVPGRPDVAVLADFFPGGEGQASVAGMTQWLATAHERFIRAYPDQWYMFRDMWPGEP
jgi:KDO2-lipid IV(A) lauroyltransferase